MLSYITPQKCITNENLAEFARCTQFRKYDYMLAAILDAILHNRKMHHFQTVHPPWWWPPSMSPTAWKILTLRVQLKVHGFNKLTHCRFTSIVGFIRGFVLMMTNSRAGSHGQDHFLTSLHYIMIITCLQTIVSPYSIVVRVFPPQSSIALHLWLSLCCKFCACALADFFEYNLE